MLKKLLLGIAYLIILHSTHAQNVYVADNDLIVYLNNSGFSGCLTGDSINISCPAVQLATKLNITGYDVSDIEALTQFPNLDTLIAINCGIQYINSSFESTLKYLDLGYNQITYLVNLPFSLEYLNISNNQLTDLSSLPYQLKYLNCSYNQLSLLPTFPPFLNYLDCSNNQLTGMPTMNTALQHLNASHNQLPSTPSLAINSLRRVWLNNNLFTSVPQLSDSLRYLNLSNNLLNYIPPINAPQLDTLLVSHNQVTSTPSFMGALKLLDFSNNLISTVPAFPSMNESCKILASHNTITSITTLPALLSYFDVSYNSNLSNLGTLPSSLTYLDCSYCNFNQLQSLPPSLSTLQCSKNPLVNGIISLPISLSSFYADSAQLTILPDLPPTLLRLQVKGNLLTELINLPSSLRYLNASDNNLTNISSSSTIFSQFLVNDNANLFCLPPIFQFTGNNSSQYSIAQTGISCLPNIIEYSFSSPMFDTLSPCGMFSNPSNCQIYWNIVGNVYLDQNQDCIQNTSEPELNSIKVMLKQGGIVVQQAFTNVNGWYSFNTDLTEYEVLVDTADLPFTPVCPINNSYICNPGGSGDTLLTGISFSLTCEPGRDLSSISMVHTSGMFFPMQIATMKYTCGDLASAFGATCNTSGLSGSIRFTCDGPGEFYDPLTQVTLGDTLILPVPDWAAVDFDLPHYVHVQTDMYPIPGDFMTIKMAVIATSGIDVQPENDTLIASYEVVNSFDPNYKEVFPVLVGAGGEWLYYTIHFQNTGTAPAINIVVKDTLSSWLDWNTFSRLDASHYNVTQVFENGIVHFNFPNIMLVDSTTNAEESQGWVQFKIKTVNPLPGAFLEIPNRASIYFDFNEPVNTEYCKTRYCLPMNRTQSITICAGDSFQVGSRWYSQTGMYVDSLQNIYGCDSLIRTSLYVRNSEIPDTVSLFACTGSSFNFDGNVYPNPGILTFHVPTSLACDSILVLRMEWIEPGPLEEVVHLCGIDSFIVDGITYYEPDTVTYLVNIQGCEYTLIYFLVQDENVDVPIQLHPEYLETIGGYEAYQWFNCVSGDPIIGQTDSIYYPNSSGTYSVTITTSTGCQFRSPCESIEVLSANTIPTDLLHVYPNPANSQCIVKLPESNRLTNLEILDPTGRRIMQRNIEGLTSISLSLEEMAAGIYWIRATGIGIESHPIKLIIY